MGFAAISDPELYHWLHRVPVDLLIGYTPITALTVLALTHHWSLVKKMKREADEAMHRAEEEFRKFDGFGFRHRRDE